MKKHALVLAGIAAALSLSACGKSAETQNTQVEDITVNEAPLNDELAAPVGNIGDNVIAGDTALNAIGPVDNAH